MITSEMKELFANRVNDSEEADAGYGVQDYAEAIGAIGRHEFTAVSGA